MATDVLQHRRFSAAEYRQMLNAGVFAPEEKIELIDGEVVPMSPIGNRHAACVRRLLALFRALPAEAAIIDVQSPVDIGADYVPEPDLALLRPCDDYYAAQAPTAADCLLLIEVADSSLERDRLVKVPRYARAGVAELWLVDLEHARVVVYREPSEDGFRAVSIARPGDTIAPLAVPDLHLPVRSIFG